MQSGSVHYHSYSRKLKKAILCMFFQEKSNKKNLDNHLTFHMEEVHSPGWLHVTSWKHGKFTAIMLHCRKFIDHVALLEIQLDARMELDIDCDIIHSIPLGEPAYSQKTDLPLEGWHHRRQDGAGHSLLHHTLRSCRRPRSFSQKTNLPLEGWHHCQDGAGHSLWHHTLHFL